jgi:hypothetical protein
MSAGTISFWTDPIGCAYFKVCGLGEPYTNGEYIFRVKAAEMHCMTPTGVYFPGKLLPVSETTIQDVANRVKLDFHRLTPADNSGTVLVQLPALRSAYARSSRQYNLLNYPSILAKLDLMEPQAGPDLKESPREVKETPREVKETPREYPRGAQNGDAPVDLLKDAFGFAASEPEETSDAEIDELLRALNL